MPNSTADTSPQTDASPTPNAHPASDSIINDQPLEVEHNIAGPTSSRDSTIGKIFMMNEVYKYILSIVILSVGIAVLIYVLSNKAAEDTVSPKDGPQQVAYENPTPYYGEITRKISGTVVPFREMKIAAQVSGEVKRKDVRLEAGTKIEDAEPLIEIDPQLYQIQLDTAVQELQQASDQVNEIEKEILGAENLRKNTMSEIDLVQDEYDRIKKIGTKSEITQAERSKLVADNSLTNLENNISNLRARKSRMVTSEKVAAQKLKKAELDEERTKIFAPIGWIVVREMVQEGDYVRAGDPLFILEDIETAEIITNLTPTDLLWLKTNSPNLSADTTSESPTDDAGVPKTPVTITDPDLINLGLAGGDPSWVGNLVSVNGSGRDESTRTIPCRIVVEDPIWPPKDIDPPQYVNSPKFRLVRGMYVKLEMSIKVSASEGDSKYYKIPSDALSDTGETLWAVDDSDPDQIGQQVLHKIDVEVVDRNAGTDYSIIRKPDDLPEHFKIITSPFDPDRATARTNLKDAEGNHVPLFEY
ncbi:MAG: efflux RND transporter periplasmic adaptor subunit [Pirellulales bacterium]|jgi:multidrug efflux pump subunit AcrA (membrane-fusion protein)